VEFGFNPGCSGDLRLSQQEGRNPAKFSPALQPESARYPLARLKTTQTTRSYFSRYSGASYNVMNFARSGLRRTAAVPAWNG